MPAIRKITVHVAEALLNKAQAETGEGVTETVRQGLGLVVARHAYDRLRDLRGRVRVKVNLKELRRDHR